MTQKDTSNSISLDHFFRGALSVDLVLITFHQDNLKILLQPKDEFPFEKKLGLPGRMILPNEDTDKAIDKLMKQLIGTCDFYKKQLRAFSEIDRHPLGRVISFSYYGLIPFFNLNEELTHGLRWYDIHEIPDLRLDHKRIVNTVIKRFRKGLLRHPIVFELLQDKFILSEIKTIYEQAFDQKLDVPNFRKKLLSSDLISPLGEFRKSPNDKGRPAELYSKNATKNKKKLKDRISFTFTS